MDRVPPFLVFVGLAVSIVKSLRDVHDAVFARTPPYELKSTLSHYWSLKFGLRSSWRSARAKRELYRRRNAREHVEPATIVGAIREFCLVERTAMQIAAKSCRWIQIYICHRKRISYSSSATSSSFQITQFCDRSVRKASYWTIWYLRNVFDRMDFNYDFGSMSRYHLLIRVRYNFFSLEKWSPQNLTRVHNRKCFSVLFQIGGHKNFE